MTGVDARVLDLDHPALTVVRRLGAAVHVRRFYQVVGYMLPNNFLVHNSSLTNLVRGVLTRVLLVKGKPTPKPLSGIYSARLSNFRKLLFKCVSSTTPLTRQEFVDCYKGRKHDIYQKALDSLVHQSLTTKDAQIKAFVKAEFINSDDKPDPDPRVISPRDPRYNVEVGRYLRPLEHKVYAAVAKIFKEPTILKGYNSLQTGQVFADKWGKYRNPVAVGLDASRFDQHVSVQALEWEHSIYNGIFKSKELSWLLKMQLRNKVTGYCRDGKVSYTTEGCRMSGDMNTALGNCVIMCGLVHAYLEHCGISGSLANNGDDCTVIFEREHLEKFQHGLQEWFLEMGFNMKVEDPVYDIEKIEFCQTHPVWLDGGYLMVRNFPKGLSKDCLSLKTMSSPRVCRMWLDAVGQGGLSLTGGIPICQDFYSAYIKMAATIKVPNNSKRTPDGDISGGLFWLSRGMKLHYKTPSARTRHSFYLAFGVTPDQQISIESEIRDVKWRYEVKEFGELVQLPKWA